MIARAERTGLGLSVAGHVAVFAALSLGLFAATKPPMPTTQPIDVQLVDKIGLTDTAPEPPMVEPAQSVAPEIGATEDTDSPAEPTPPLPTPAPVQREAVAPPKAAPAPKPAPKAVAKPTPATPAPARGSRLGENFLKGLSDRPTASTSQAPRATAVGPAQQAALGRLIREQLKPHWRAPTGADADQLRTELRVSLSINGSVTSVDVIGTSGQNESNRSQVRPHQEAAIKAVKLASPFTGLPAELYNAWSVLETVGFDRRLSQ